MAVPPQPLVALKAGAAPVAMNLGATDYVLAALGGTGDLYRVPRAALQAFLGLEEGTWGSNANGFWVRHQSGVQECWHVITEDTVDWGTSNGAAGFRRSAPLVWTFPQPFANATVVVTPTPERDASVIMGAGILPSSLTQARIMPWAAVSLLAGATKAVRLHAIGRHYV